MPARSAPVVEVITFGSASEERARELVRTMTKTYPVGIVGEANYQSAIRRCSSGQRVHILHEPDNPYDAQALVVVADDGATLGYIPRDCWLKEAVHDEGRGCEASIRDIASGDAGTLGVVLNVTPSGRGIAKRAFSRAPAVAEVPKGWLARLLGL